MRWSEGRDGGKLVGSVKTVWKRWSRFWIGEIGCGSGEFWVAGRVTAWIWNSSEAEWVWTHLLSCWAEIALGTVGLIPVRVTVWLFEV